MSFFSSPGRVWLARNLPRIPRLIHLTWGLFRDPRVERRHKSVLLGVLAYVVSPLNLIPNFIPLIGQIDDLLILLVAIEWFSRLAPSEVVAELEQKYRDGHSPLHDDLRKAREYGLAAWEWLSRFVQSFADKYGDKVDDAGYVKRLEQKTVNSEQ